MTTALCTVCGGALDAGNIAQGTCPSCGRGLAESRRRRAGGEEARRRSGEESRANEEESRASGEEAGYATRHLDGLDNAARIATSGGATTFFQPSLMASGVDHDAGEAPHTEIASPVALGATMPGATMPDAAVTAEPLRLDFEAFFLILGAPPGKERIRLERARTTFGRKRADVDLGDPTVSAFHFHIDVMGSELFVRDLDSKNGTFLNAHKVRYSELLPGDELRAGDTVLIFRTSEDGLSRSS